MACICTMWQEISRLSYALDATGSIVLNWKPAHQGVTSFLWSMSSALAKSIAPNCRAYCRFYVQFNCFHFHGYLCTLLESIVWQTKFRNFHVLVWKVALCVEYKMYRRAVFLFTFLSTLRSENAIGMWILKHYCEMRKVRLYASDCRCRIHVYFCILLSSFVVWVYTLCTQNVKFKVFSKTVDAFYIETVCCMPRARDGVWAHQSVL